MAAQRLTALAPHTQRRFNKSSTPVRDCGPNAISEPPNDGHNSTRHRKGVKPMYVDAILSQLVLVLLALLVKRNHAFHGLVADAHGSSQR
jgi:hypothetical protein